MTTTKHSDAMKGFRFGIEIETVGRTRQTIANAVAKALNLPAMSVAREGGYYDKWTVKLEDGRKWTFMSDASLSNQSASAEVVSPILVYGDMDMLQTVVRAVREAGASVDQSCGIHVHVDAAPFDAAGLTRLAKLVYQQEELLLAALGVRDERSSRWCKRVDETFIRKLQAERPRDRDAVMSAWYGNATEAQNATRIHYHQSRYRGLNLHSVQYRGTVEFRYFEGTLHAGEVKSYVQLVLAIAAKALLARTAVARKREFNKSSAKYDVRVFLLRLELIGDEFKTARHHLLKRLEGSAAWKNGRPVAQTESAPIESVESLAG